MKELLYGATLILLFYILYLDRSIINLITVAVSIVILMIYMFSFKFTINEQFITTPIYINEDYKEILSENMIIDLVYYVSTFNKKNVNFKQNSLLNVMTSDIGGLLDQNITEFKYDYYSQYNGIKIIDTINITSAKLTLESFDTFSMFWYINIHSDQSTFIKGNNSISLVYFKHSNILTGSRLFDLFEIKMNFLPDKLNPEIAVYFIGNKLETKYTYESIDYFNKKIFADNKYHLFTFVKESSKYRLYMDEHLLMECVEDNQCFDMKNIKLDNDGTEIELQNQSIQIFRNIDVPISMNGFGIYRNRALILDDVKELNKHYIHIKLELSPDYNNILLKNKDLNNELNRYTKACPFSDETICSSKECFDVKNWKDINNLLDHKECFHKVVNYCHNIHNTENDPLCEFLKKDKIFKMASTLDSNLFMYDPNNKTNLNDKNNVKVLEQLDKLGLKNIYLDKSYRDTSGKYSGEMKRLINDLLTTNQTVDIDTLNALHNKEIDTNITDDIDYNNLFNNVTLSNNNDYTNMYNELLAKEEKTPVDEQLPNVKKVKLNDNNNMDIKDEMENDLIDLNYNEIDQPDVYNNILKKHKQNTIEKEYNNSGWNFLKNLF